MSDENKDYMIQALFEDMAKRKERREDIKEGLIIVLCIIVITCISIVFTIGMFTLLGGLI